MPQIEIMQADLPHTLYDRSGRNERGGKRSKRNENFKYNPSDPAIEKQMEEIDRQRKRLKAEGKNIPYTMDELFNK